MSAENLYHALAFTEEATAKPRLPIEKRQRLGRVQQHPFLEFGSSQVRSPTLSCGLSSYSLLGRYKYGIVERKKCSTVSPYFLPLLINIHRQTLLVIALKSRATVEAAEEDVTTTADAVEMPINYAESCLSGFPLSHR